MILQALFELQDKNGRIANHDWGRFTSSQWVDPTEKYHMVGLDSYNVVPPVDSVQLVHITPITMVFGTYNYSFHGV